MIIVPKGWTMTNPKWLEWAQKLQALAQAGLTYTENPYDKERYHAIREIAAEMFANHTDIDLPVMRDLYESQAGYITPKVDVRGVVFRDGQILLVKELADGGWTLPGGWVDVNEPPSTAVEREVWEESGYRVRANKILAIYDRNLHGHPAYIFHIYKLFILCELISGEPTTSLETGGAVFYPKDHLPTLSIARTTQEEIDRFFEHHFHPDWPTDFD
jgi:ADP-ribose pyrophosphatase YjhB (NUDIX family)